MQIQEILSELTFYGRTCTKDCSGHKAGHQWAQNKTIADPRKCSGSSNSFIGGCEVSAHQTAVAKVRQQPIPRSYQRSKSGKFISKGNAAFGQMAQQLGPKPPTV